MRSAQSWLTTIARIAWVALRFVLFGIGGFGLLIFFFIEFIAGVRSQGSHSLTDTPLLALPIALSGALMMLFGVGEWGRWAYLWVILSIPITLLVVSTILPGDKGLTVGIFIAVTASASHTAVRAYYRRRTPTVSRPD